MGRGSWWQVLRRETEQGQNKKKNSKKTLIILIHFSSFLSCLMGFFVHISFYFIVKELFFALYFPKSPLVVIFSPHVLLVLVICTPGLSVISQESLPRRGPSWPAMTARWRVRVCVRSWVLSSVAAKVRFIQLFEINPSELYTLWLCDVEKIFLNKIVFLDKEYFLLWYDTVILASPVMVFLWCPNLLLVWMSL